MSRLIDEVLENRCVMENVNDKWYLAKPLNKPSLLERIKDAIRIIRNKSFAVHYKEDENKELLND